MTVSSREISAPRSVGALRNIGLAAWIVTFMLTAVAIYLVLSFVVEWGQVRLDDMRYGRPRTTHLEGFVGHPAEQSGRPTRFMALNLERQIVVLELPGGDANQARSLPGPYLFGAREHLTPVLLSLADVDGDGRADLIATIRNEQIIYLNRDESFRLPTPEEQQRIMQEHRS
jgi:hypothetical protein